LWVGLENAGRKSPVRFRTAFFALSINSKQNIFFTILSAITLIIVWEWQFLSSVIAFFIVL
jgi:hypothetical protein